MADTRWSLLKAINGSEVPNSVGNDPRPATSLYPSWPERLSPQHLARPSLNIAQFEPSPLSMETTPVVEYSFNK